MDRIEDDLPPGVKVAGYLSDASACDVTVEGFAGRIHVERSSLRVEGPPGLPPDSLVEQFFHEFQSRFGGKKGLRALEGEETGNENAEDVTKSLLAFWPCAGMILVASRRQPRAAYHTDIFSQSHLGVRHGTRRIFPVSLAVKDLEASRQFYEQSASRSSSEMPAQNWLILKNGDHVIGLFQGMFDKNILTFNPGWDQKTPRSSPPSPTSAASSAGLKAQGVPLVNEADETTTGPASFIAVDPDGNPISSSISTSEPEARTNTG